jgi:hypothetical protein
MAFLQQQPCIIIRAPHSCGPVRDEVDASNHFIPSLSIQSAQSSMSSIVTQRRNSARDYRWSWRKKPQYQYGYHHRGDNNRHGHIQKTPISGFDQPRAQSIGDVVMGDKLHANQKCRVVPKTTSMANEVAVSVLDQDWDTLESASSTSWYQNHLFKNR